MTTPLGTAHLYPKWNISISVGAPDFDEDHRHLLEQIGAVATLIDQGDAAPALTALDRMVAALDRHFRAEERFFSDSSYPHATAHRIEHRVLRHMARHVRGAIDLSPDSAMAGLSLRHFAQAMVEHIIEIDGGYRAFLDERIN